MLTFHFPKKVKFICALIYQDETVYSKVKVLLERKFGALDFESKPILFDFTDYYCAEMGGGLTKRLVAFKKLQDAARFVQIKRSCVALETRYSRDTRRSINIDPGYLNEAHLVLTSTKDFYHRLYLGKGVFAEVTLYYAHRQFQDLPWTYPDYRTGAHKEMLMQIRNVYVGQIKKNSR
ncbi:MAG: DUF4416 family protein [Candidatus Omnitrophica bacterium]|nr:DUF4416 family protein [Candidatus Omnitrophota bacterium]